MFSDLVRNNSQISALGCLKMLLTKKNMHLQKKKDFDFNFSHPTRKFATSQQIFLKYQLTTRILQLEIYHFTLNIFL